MTVTHKILDTARVVDAIAAEAHRRYSLASFIAAATLEAASVTIIS